MEGKTFRRLDGVYRQTVTLVWDIWKNNPFRLPILILTILVTLIGSASFLSQSQQSRAESGSADAARLYTTGFELQSTDAGEEYTANVTTTPAIDTTNERSGASALQTSNSSAVEGIEYDFRSANTADDHYYRAYIRVADAPGQLTNVMEFYDSGNTVQSSLRLNSNLTLELWNDEDSAQIGSDSTAIALNTWTRLEMRLDCTGTCAAAGTAILDGRIDGVSFASETNVNHANGVMTVRLGILTAANEATDFSWDDVAVNDDSGGKPISWPGEGKVVNLRPNGNGSNTAWTGDYTAVDETNPNDGTDYINCSVASQLEDYGLTDSSTAGISAGDRIKLADGNIRHGSSASGARTQQFLFKQSATTEASLSVSVNLPDANTWVNNLDDGVVNKNALLTAYNDIGSSNHTPLSAADLDSLEVQVTASDCTPQARITAIWVTVEYETTLGGRMFSSGFELQSVVADEEWTTVTNTPAIDTTTFRYGAASLRATGWSSGTAESTAFTFKAANSVGPFFARTYLRIATVPASGNTNRIISFRDSGGTDRAYITLLNSGSLQLFDEDGQVGSDSSALSTATWYRIELKIDCGSACDDANDVIEATINGATAFATASNRDLTNGVNQFVVGANLGAAAITAGDWYFDDVAVNENVGSSQNGYPGPGAIFHIKPSTTGDSETWTSVGTENPGCDAAGDANWGCYDEITPDETTSYATSTTADQIDDVALADPGNFLPDNAPITLVQAGVRFTNSSTPVSTFRVRLKDNTAISTVESDQIVTNSTTWFTNNNTSPRLSPLTMYTRPDRTDAWTETALNSTQIGIRLDTDGGTNTVNVSTLWLLVEFSSGVNLSGTSDMTSGTVKCRFFALDCNTTGTIAGDGSWTISTDSPPATCLIIWVDGAADDDESTIMTDNDLGGTIGGLQLNRHQLFTGSNQDLQVNCGGGYDNDDDEDIMFSWVGSGITVDSDDVYSDDLWLIDSGDNFMNISTATFTTHDFTVNGTITFGNATISALTLSGSLDNNGAISCSSCTFAPTFTFTSTVSETIDYSGVDFDSNGWTFNGSGGSWTLTGTIPSFTSSLTIRNGTLQGTGTMSVGTIICNTTCGSVNMTGGTITGTTATGNFGTTALTSNWTFYNLTLTGTGTTTAQGDGTITVSSVFTLGTGKIFAAGSKTYSLTGSGTPLVVTGTLTEDTSIFSYDSTTTANVTADTYETLRFNAASGSPTYTLLGAVTVDDDLIINRGTVEDAGNQITGNGTGVMTMASGTTLKIGNGTATTFPTSYTNGNTTLNAVSTVIYNATTSQNISNTPTYGHLQLSAASGTPTKTLLGNTVAAGTVTIDANNTLDVDNTGNFSLSIGDSYANSGTFTARAGTVTFTATDGGNTLSGTMTGGSAFNNLIFDGSGGAWATASATVTGDLTMTAGTLSNTGSPTIIVNGHVTGTGGAFNLTNGGFEQRASSSKNFGTTSGSTAWVFNTLTFGNSHASSPITITAQSGGTGTITISSQLRVGKSGDAAGATTTLDASNRSWILSGTSGDPFQLLASPAGALTANTSLFTYTANALGNSTVQAATYYDLTFNASEIFELEGSTTVTRDLTITSGTLDTVSGQNHPLAIGRNYANSGTFTARSGTVTLNGSGTQTLSGTMTSGSAFYDLTITNSSGTSASDCELTSWVASVDFAASATITHNYTIATNNVRVEYNNGSTYTIANINWDAAASNMIYFRNSVASGSWLLNVSGTQTAVNYVNVSRSDATGSASPIDADDGTNTDCNNNTNWNFGGGSPTFEQADFRFAQPNGLNVTYDIGVAENAAYSTSGTGDDFRLRMLIHVGTANLGISGQNFKLRFGEKTASDCTSGVSWADVSDSSGVIRYYDGGSRSDGDDLTTNVNDPSHSGHTKVAQDYEEVNNFTNSVAAINSGEDGLWDFSLVNNSAVGGKRYCFKATEPDNTDLDTYTFYPEVIIDEELIFSLDATSKDFGVITPGGNPTNVSSTLTTTTNSSTGYVIYTYSTQLMTMGGFTIPDWTGTNSSPTAFGNGSFGFGYTTDDASLTGGTADRFTNGGAKYAGFVHSGPGDPVADRTSGPVSSQTDTVTYRLAASSSQAAGTYTTTIVYVCSVTF